MHAIPQKLNEHQWHSTPCQVTINTLSHLQTITLNHPSVFLIVIYIKANTHVHTR